MMLFSNHKPYYWFTSPVDGKTYQFTSLLAAKAASKQLGVHVKVFKYEPGKGSHVIFETKKPSSDK